MKMSLKRPLCMTTLKMLDDIKILDDGPAIQLGTPNDPIRIRSGSVTSDDPLVSFFYVLIRDHVTPGIIEEVIKRARVDGGENEFSNGWLATYAKDIASRLTK